MKKCYCSQCEVELKYQGQEESLCSNCAGEEIDEDARHEYWMDKYEE